MRRIAVLGASAALLLTGCEAGDAPEATNEAMPAGNEALAGNGRAADAAPAMPDCPFRRTSEWVGSVEDGRVLVNGRVDLMMAGMRPEVTVRAGAAPGTLALDLALAPDPQAAVNDRVRYEGHGSYRRGEIWCGGERIAQFDMIVVG